MSIKNMGWKLAVLTGAVGLVIGGGLGAGIAVANQPEPTHEVIEVEREVEVEVEKEVAAQECREAIAAGIELISLLEMQASDVELLQATATPIAVNEADDEWNESLRECHMVGE